MRLAEADVVVSMNRRGLGLGSGVQRLRAEGFGGSGLRVLRLRALEFRAGS